MSVRRGVTIGALVVAAVVAAVIVVGSRGSASSVHATFDSAVNLVPGNEVQVAGVPVGSVGSIEVTDEGADVELKVDDDRVWPLHEGTAAQIRFGGTVSYSNRYVELTPGPDSAPPLADGAHLPRADAVAAVEFDQLFGIFDRKTRRGFGRLIDGGARNFGPEQLPSIQAGIDAAGPGFGEAAETLRRIGADPYALRTLVASGASASEQLAARSPELVGLVDSAGATFEEISDHAQATSTTLERLPGTLNTATGTLSRLDRSLGGLDTLVGEIAPGAAKAPRLADRANGAIARLERVAPNLERTLSAVDTWSAGITEFLDRTKPLAERLTPTLAGVEPITSCVRPYVPEIAGFFSTWSTLGNTYDPLAHYGRALFQTFGFPSSMPVTSEQITSLIPNLGYAFLRPPGYGASQERFYPECGATPDWLDPAQDPEAAPNLPAPTASGRASGPKRGSKSR